MLTCEIWLWVFQLSFDDVVIVHVLVCVCGFFIFPPQNC